MAIDQEQVEESARTGGRIADFLSAAEIADLNTPRIGRTLLDAASIWGGIFGCLALAILYSNPLLLMLCFIVIASRQLALTHLVHDASHYRLTKNKILNDWISDVLFAAPVLISTQQYRAQHLPHHRNLGDSQLDTDQRAWYSIRGWHFLRRSVLILLGWEALLTFLSYSNTSQNGDSSKNSGLIRRLTLVFITNGFIFLYCWLLGNPWMFFAMWVFPMFTLTMYLLTLRVIAEHQTVAYARLGKDEFRMDIEYPLTRTLRSGFWGRFFLGSCNFNYHHEHHLAPAVPYSNLPRLHCLLVERGYYNRYPEALSSGYFSTLRKLVFP